MTEGEYEHLPWCPDPNHPWSCELQHQVGDELVVVLTAGQCDPGSVHLEVQGAVQSTAELTALVSALQGFAEPLAVAESETECVGHNHVDDAEGEEDEDEGLHCDYCNTDGHLMVWPIDGVGRVAQDCGCLEALGYRVVGRFDLERI